MPSWGPVWCLCVCVLRQFELETMIICGAIIEKCAINCPIIVCERQPPHPLPVNSPYSDMCVA